VNQSRRRFVGQCAAVAGTAAVSATIGRTPAEAAQPQPLANWAGNYRYGTSRITSATSLAQVQAFVRAHPRFKVLGTRHCFNGIADSTDQFLSLREMHAVVGLDRAAGTVTVESGTSYGQLCPSLDRDGFALHWPRSRTSRSRAPAPPARTARA
jgi:xylitol oxidase